MCAGMYGYEKEKAYIVVNLASRTGREDCPGGYDQLKINNL
jgi:hypothetical protein